MRLICTLSVLLTCLTQLAHATCQPVQTNVAVNLKIVAPVVTQPYGARQLAANIALPSWYKGSAPPVGGRFQSGSDIKYNIVPQITNMPDGTFCYGIAQISYLYTAINSQIQVAKEIPPGSCSYNAVIQHESRHYIAVRDLMAQKRATYEADLRTFAQRLGTSQTKDVASAANTFYSQIYSFVNGQITQFYAEASQRHAAIDTVEEGQRAYTVCNGEIMRYIPRQ